MSTELKIAQLNPVSALQPQGGSDAVAQNSALIGAALLLNSKALLESTGSTLSVAQAVIAAPKAAAVQASSAQNANAGGMNEMEQTLIAMAQALQLVSELLTKYAAEVGDDATKIGQTLLANAQKAFQNVVKEMQELEAAKRKADSGGFFGKLFGGILTAIMAIIAVVTVQPELFAAVLIMAVIFEVPDVKDELVKGISAVLTACGITSEALKTMLSNLILIIAVAALTGGAAAAAAPEAVAEEAAEDGIEMVDMGANAAPKVAEAPEEAGDSFMQKVKNAVNKFLPKTNAGKLALMNGASAVVSTNFVASVMQEAIAADPSLKNNKEFEKLTMALEIIAAILCAVIALAAGSGLNLTGSAATPAVVMRNMATLQKVATGMEFGAQMGAAGAGGVVAYEDTVKANIDKLMGQYNSYLAFEEMLMDVVQTVGRSAQTEESQKLKTNQTVTNNFTKNFAGMAAVNNILGEIAV